LRGRPRGQRAAGEERSALRDPAPLPHRRHRDAQSAVRRPHPRHPRQPGRKGSAESRRGLNLHVLVILWCTTSPLRGRGIPMARAPFRKVTGIGMVVLALAAVGGCASSDQAPTVSKPGFYQSMAQPGAVLDAAAAESMISNYRQNNGLSVVALDPHLMK